MSVHSTSTHTYTFMLLIVRSSLTLPSVLPGKTFTMMGCKPHDPKEVTENAGLYVLAAREIFSKLNGRGRNGHRQNPNVSNLSLYVSCFEIYGGKLYDLLNEHMVVKCMEDAKQHVQLLGAYVTFLILLYVLTASSIPSVEAYFHHPYLSSPPSLSSSVFSTSILLFSILTETPSHLFPSPPSHRSIGARGG
jgi:Kinesin motor domain